jgi:hypothetical protein
MMHAPVMLNALEQFTVLPRAESNSLEACCNKVAIMIVMQASLHHGID